MGVNNFKNLEEVELEDISLRTAQIKSNIGSNIGGIRFITNVIELYFPRIVDLFVGMAGGSSGHIEDKENAASKYPDMR